MKLARFLLVFILMMIPVTCGAAFESTPPDRFGGPREGEKAPNVTLKNLDGNTVELVDYIGEKPIVIEFGSLTCPIFRGKHSSMEELYSKYSEKAVFLLIYTIEAHPKGDVSPYASREWVTEENVFDGILYRQPKTEEEKREIAQKAVSEVDISIPLLLDDMSNNAWQAYGEAPNAAYLIGTDGKIKLRQGWFDPEKFERVLKQEF